MNGLEVWLAAGITKIVARACATINGTKELPRVTQSNNPYTTEWLMPRLAVGQRSRYERVTAIS